MKKFFLILYFVMFSIEVLFAQTYQIQGQTNPCASTPTTYSLVAVGNPPSTSGCTISWTVTGGVFEVNGQTAINNVGTSVNVIWNNNVSSISGKIEATLSGSACNANIAKTYPLDVTIKTIGLFSGMSVNGTNYNCNSSISIPCGTMPITFTTSTVINATHYQWIVPNGWTISSSNSTSITVIPSQSLPSSGSVSIRATRIDCSGLQSICSINFTRPTPVANQPQATVYTLCANNSQQLTVIGTNATAINWTATNGFTISNIVNTINGSNVTSTATITAPAAGSDVEGIVTATAFSPACGNGSTTSLSFRSIGSSPTSSLLSLSGAGMTVTQGGLSLAVIYNGAFISSVPNSQLIDGVQYQSGSSSIYVSTSGLTATAYPTNGCVGGTATILVRVKNCTGNWSSWKPFTVNVCSSSGFRFVYSPNPTSDKLDITAEPTEDNKNFAIASSIDFEVKLIDKDGKVVREGKNLNKEKKITLDVKGLKEGTYFLHILHGKEAVAAAIEKHQILISK